ncbi:MAG: hypothetical protein HY784_04280 [Chloroflexi bacterium]|nr:hypothetical protein [Chloroflexota bacterium]
MMSFQRITRAFKQAPWRTQLQAAALSAAVLTVYLVLGSLFLNETSRTATDGFEVQALETRKTDLIRQNAELRARLAELRAEDRLRKRAGEIGYRPARPDEIDYLVVDGYSVPPSPAEARLAREATVALAAPAITPTPIPDFTETLGEWLVASVFGVKVEAAGSRPR